MVETLPFLHLPRSTTLNDLLRPRPGGTGCWAPLREQRFEVLRCASLSLEKGFIAMTIFSLAELICVSCKPS